ncbi:hypothetical protein [Mycolicibacterium baixiangningiae]|nr:hypothetical protein [Mycolicibacterium baixiangningiae]
MLLATGACPNAAVFELALVDEATRCEAAPQPAAHTAASDPDFA